jgi:diguanylate cyclase (GGDEF)-like protein/PAS domain S-box-containing protein
MNNLPDMIFSFDENFIITSCHMPPEISDILNLKDDDLNSRNMLDFIHESDRDMALNSIVKPRYNKRFIAREQQFRFITGDGTLRWVEMNSMSMYDSSGKIIVTNGILRDIEDRKKIEEELKFFYTIDPLTGLYNRRMATEMIEKQINLSKRNRTFLSVCFIDINDLKTANDKYGHAEGDFLIKSVASILLECTRDSDYIFRMGGDEFVILLPGCDDCSNDIIWKRFENAVNLKNSEINKPYKISLSYGFTSMDHTKKINAEELISLSDKKMYEYKRRIKGLA